MSDESKQVGLLDLEIDVILNFFIGVLSSKALLYLGISEKQSENLEKDLEKVRLAIDTTSFMVEKLEPFVNEEELKQYNLILSNLQFSFLRESK